MPTQIQEVTDQELKHLDEYVSLAKWSVKDVLLLEYLCKKAKSGSRLNHLNDQMEYATIPTINCGKYEVKALSPIEFLIRADIRNVLSCHKLSGYKNIPYGNLAYIQNPYWMCLGLYKKHNGGAQILNKFADKFGDITKHYNTPNLLATVNVLFGTIDDYPAVMFSRIYGDENLMRGVMDTVVSELSENYLVSFHNNWHVRPRGYSLVSMVNVANSQIFHRGYSRNQGYARYDDISDYNTCEEGKDFFIEEYHGVWVSNIDDKHRLPKLQKFSDHNFQPVNYVYITDDSDSNRLVCAECSQAITPVILTNGSFIGDLFYCDYCANRIIEYVGNTYSIDDMFIVYDDILDAEYLVRYTEECNLYRNQVTVNHQSSVFWTYQPTFLQEVYDCRVNHVLSLNTVPINATRDLNSGTIYTNYKAAAYFINSRQLLGSFDMADAYRYLDNKTHQIDTTCHYGVDFIDEYNRTQPQRLLLEVN